MKFSDSLENMTSVIERNFRDTIDKIEIEMKEVKEKLSSLTASAEKSTQEGWYKELLTKKKLLRATLSQHTLVLY